MENRKDELGRKPVGKLLIKYSVPAIIAMSVNALYNLTDAVFIGQGVGPLALAALSITFPITIIILGLAISTGVGTASIISRALGSGDDRKAACAGGNSFAFITILSLVITVVGLMLIGPMLRLFGATEAITPFADRGHNALCG